ncbi:MAG: hypothetical protein ACP5T4_01705 [Candidatus Micrarchaeia archaeon]
MRGIHLFGGKHVANITSIKINYMNSVHELPGMKVKDKEFELKIPFKNKSAGELPSEIKRPDLRIDEISVQNPFQLLDVSPQLPIVLHQGESTEITLKLKAPELAYSGPLLLNMQAKSQNAVHISISSIKLAREGRSVEIEGSSRSLYIEKGEVFKQDLQVRSVLHEGEMLNGIQVSKPFEFVKAGTALPVKVLGDSFVISVFIKAPDYNYSGPLEITML